MLLLILLLIMLAFQQIYVVILAMGAWVVGLIQSCHDTVVCLSCVCKGEITWQNYLFYLKELFQICKGVISSFGCMIGFMFFCSFLLSCSFGLFSAGWFRGIFKECFDSFMGHISSI